MTVQYYILYNFKMAEKTGSSNISTFRTLSSATYNVLMCLRCNNVISDRLYKFANCFGYRLLCR